MDSQEAQTSQENWRGPDGVKSQNSLEVLGVQQTIPTALDTPACTRDNSKEAWLETLVYADGLRHLSNARLHRDRLWWEGLKHESSAS